LAARLSAAIFLPKTRILYKKSTRDKTEIITQKRSLHLARVAEIMKIHHKDATLHAPKQRKKGKKVKAKKCTAGTKRE
jgi:hypothetical protein